VGAMLLKVATFAPVTCTLEYPAGQSAESSPPGKLAEIVEWGATK